MVTQENNNYIIHVHKLFYKGFEFYHGMPNANHL